MILLLKKLILSKEHHDDPFHRIDYMSAYALNSPFSLSLQWYFAILKHFDGGILIN